MIERLVAWFRSNQRDLPWRRTYDPYHVWVSEAMLQQTQVETVVPYYERFIQEFPSVHSLASAGEARALQLWAGLGYYRRAKNLIAAARQIVENHGGRIPSEFDQLITLPGIGRYMAGAILSIAFNKPYPVVDGNVRRVLSRLYGWKEDSPKLLWETAERLVHDAEPRILNQALMELGATVCSFKSPRCLLCPVQTPCVAFQTGMQNEIPTPKRRPRAVHVRLFAVVQERKGLYLMKQTEGLWEFPMFAEMPAGSFREVGACRHTITHHRLDVTVYAGELERQDGYLWKDFETIPVSSLTKKILRTAESQAT